MKAVFLDRDGVINRDIGYIWKRQDFEWLPKVPEAIKYLKSMNYLVIVITNQAGVAKNLYTLKDVIELHKQINNELKSNFNTKIDDFFICPHKNEDNCNCRKPKPGMIIEAIKKWNIDEIDKSFLIGDKLIDIEAARAANVTGYLLNPDLTLYDFILKIMEAYHER